ncbi:prepilin-type N-terminal cleavage/methylation domain-containing protein [Leptothoe sp. PORK10 BA2]|uniref:prepilin-type N-terminal cleavage/methylation domain-containing protein n=1 Tax=Leptothoe sp. PORK10 BA2 TaxID=3110254 RepID=UPI002B1FFE88|nr:prepilin-type N-terminal cleavage/methylation domain-containing protein [Leptothoe sp. PORK10 BA2]MEA5466006.1 prepilin-type N-terminal cleavage/methylation domain-containing protein [Leptothoe sp. PORK10 BA2]
MLKRVFKKHVVKYPTNQGFTLIEILISMVMAGIIISGLMFLVVDLLRTDQRELTLERTQQDMKRALDYIADDVREAIYVYDDPTSLVAALKITASSLPTDARPVMAFWKVKPLDANADDYSKLSTPGTAACNGLAATPLANCRALLIRHGYYELVIYYSTDLNDPDWEGKARVYRYSVPEYSTAALTDGNSATLLVSSIFVEDSSKTPPQGGTPSPSWVPNESGAGTLRGDVLVDFVADLAATPAPPACEVGYTQIPTTTTGATASNSFYACIRPSDEANNLLNQDVSIYLRGDADPKDSSLVLGGVSGNSELPTLQTRVLTRGVVNKDLP